MVFKPVKNVLEKTITLILLFEQKILHYLPVQPTLMVFKPVKKVLEKTITLILIVGNNVLLMQNRYTCTKTYIEK